MTIAVQCGGCHKRLSAEEKLAGRKVKCPQCGAVLVIPKPQPEPAGAAPITSLLDEYDVSPAAAGTIGKPAAGAGATGGGEPDMRPKCPSCGKFLDVGAVLCVDCGYNLLTRKRREELGSKESERRGFPWLQVSAIGGMCAFAVLVGVVIYVLFQPKAAVGVGSSGTVEPPKEFTEVEFGEKEYLCEYPKGWEVTHGGGKEGVPPWIKFEKGGASIEIRDSLSGTPGAQINRTLKMGTAIERGEAPVEDVHQHRKKFVAESLPKYEESAERKLDHLLGDGLLSEFTAKPLLSGAIHGYRATVLHGYHQFNILCLCAESEWKILEPAFTHVISTLEPVEDEELLGIMGGPPEE
ncbi:MAG: zinc ribbon domain-containing protein [Thermoguttaceae bacterium]